MNPNKSRVTFQKENVEKQSEIPFKRLKNVELQTRRENGMCYRCEENFFPGHHCKKKEL